MPDPYQLHMIDHIQMNPMDLHMCHLSQMMMTQKDPHLFRNMMVFRSHLLLDQKKPYVKPPTPPRTTSAPQYGYESGTVSLHRREKQRQERQNVTRKAYRTSAMEQASPRDTTRSTTTYKPPNRPPPEDELVGTVISHASRVPIATAYVDQDD